MAFTAGTTNVKDAAGTNTALRTYDDGTAQSFAHPVLDSSGAIIDPATAGNQSTANVALSAIQTAVEGTLTVDGSGVTQPISAASLPLPTGAATSANQSTANSTLSAIQAAVEGTLTVNGSASTQPVSAASLPLPTGASTAANQTTANTALAAIQTAVEGTVSISAASLPLPTGGATSANQDTANKALSGIQAAIEGTITVDGSGVTQPVSASSLPLPTGAATAANQGTANTALSAIETNTDNIPTLDNDKSPVIPSMTSGGNLSLQTAATGTNYTTFASQACKQLTLSNQTDTTVEVQQGGSGAAFEIPTGAFYTFFGITNANQLGVRRSDTSNTQVTVTARWES